jgi:acyl-CoA hydrolase
MTGNDTQVLKPRAVSESHTVMTQLVFPEHANALGKAFGGQIMAWSDMCGGICSMRHSGGNTVTASIDDLHFDRPVNIGDTVIIEARVNAAFTTSMEIEVTVEGENPVTRERWRCVDALMTFVAIDAQAKPRRVPPLLLDSAEVRERADAATVRREERLAKRRANPKR